MILLSTFLISLKVFWEKYKKLYISIASALTAIGTLAICAVTPLRVRVISIFAMRNDSSNSFRFNVYKSSFQMFKDNWLVGIGQGNQNFREVYGLYMKTGFDALSAYNIYLETAVESGIFALVMFLGFLITLLVNGIKYILKTDNRTNLILVAIPVLSIIGTMFHGLVDTVFFRPQLQIVFWTMCAILSNRLYCKD
jgi:putative inorganic carbon (HCO3(-)) transporter